jgi:dipeptidyl aminopeptidase/acylaminoacyl peptidase
LTGQIEAPILLLHGRDDSVVPLEQSQLMQRALRGDNVPVDFIDIPEGDHWLSSTASRRIVLQSLEAFLEEHIGQ